MKRIYPAVVVIFSSFSHAENIAFIGSPLAVERSQKPCMEFIEQTDPDSGLEAVCMDRAFSLKYEVRESILGASSEGVVEFIGLYHYRGMPSYTMHEPALVILSKEKDHLHLRYIEPVEKRGGDWWLCKEWSEENEEVCTREVKAKYFAKQFTEKN